MSATTGRNRATITCSLIALSICIVGSALTTRSAQAQAWEGRGPWCYDQFDGPGYDCSFYSYEQCMQTASGLSNSCSRNPLYVPPRTPASRTQVRPKRHHSHR
jgi:hypothetical protein